MLTSFETKFWYSNLSIIFYLFVFACDCSCFTCFFSVIRLIIGLKFMVLLIKNSIKYWNTSSLSWQVIFFIIEIVVIELSQLFDQKFSSFSFKQYIQIFVTNLYLKHRTNISQCYPLYKFIHFNLLYTMPNISMYLEIPITESWSNIEQPV